MALFILHEETRYSTVHIQQLEQRKAPLNLLDKSHKQSLLVYINQGDCQ